MSGPGLPKPWKLLLMSDGAVAVLLVTHAPLGGALRAVVEHVYGEAANLTVMDVTAGQCADDSTDGLLERMRALDQGPGVLLLTDLPGASPANICKRACEIARSAGMKCEVLAGVNAAMVLRAINHCSNGLSKATIAAIEGASLAIKRVD